jgi:hypothetical protein
MSKNCVDTVIDIANEYCTPLMLIASRRQIECEELGGGYVNGWSTEEFSRYVSSRDKFGYTVLCRDHGGPWQGSETERAFGLEQAMDSAKRSYEVDILSDFKVIHIDPCVDPLGPPDRNTLQERLFELLEFCVETSRKHNKEIYTEVGTEQINGRLEKLKEFEYFLEAIRRFCEQRGYEQPVFAVGQTGTLLKETRNVGTFHINGHATGESPTETCIPQLVDACEAYDFLLKEHNGDYLSDEVLDLHPKLGIHAVNVAPQLGVAETRVILDTCDLLGLADVKHRFLKLSLDSLKWEKWLEVNSKAGDYEKSIIAGHYVFSSPEFKELKEEIAIRTNAMGMDLDGRIKDELKSVIMNFAKRLGLLELKVTPE